MKRILAILLSVILVLSLASCTKTQNEEVKDDTVITQEQSKTENNAEVSDNKKEEVKTENDVNSDKKPQEEKPVQKPEEKPTEKPKEEKPVEKPEEKPEKTTLGYTLLNDFKSKANSGLGVEGIADSLLQNPAIKFSGGVIPVEEGLLSGFDNAEIKGFKSGAMFAPMIGSIAFVGYIFELENEADVSGFISTLEKNANKRWNICVSADEMVTGSVGNKVFFVMCPTSLDE